ncbi:MAG TPA: hypothetical protein HA349_05430 [Methanotrichaceae archaeon]|nr:hypothetical protein [Methanotrichaceae archaeon]
MAEEGEMEVKVEEGEGDRRAEESESFKSTLLPVILGLIIDLIVDTFSGLSDSAKMMVIVGLGVVYSGAELAGKRPKRFSISSKAKTLMTMAFIIAVLLILVAAIILGLSLVTTAFLVGWTILMAFTLRFAQSIPEGSVVPKVALTRIAAFTLGAALSIGGAPLVDQIIEGPAHLTIENNCDQHLRYELLGISIPPGGSQTLEIPGITVNVEHRGDWISVSGSYGPDVTFPVTGSYDLIVDDRPLRPGYSRSIDLGDGEDHHLIINCR